MLTECTVHKRNGKIFWYRLGPLTYVSSLHHAWQVTNWLNNAFPQQRTEQGGPLVWPPLPPLSLPQISVFEVWGIHWMEQKFGTSVTPLLHPRNSWEYPSELLEVVSMCKSPMQSFGTNASDLRRCLRNCLLPAVSGTQIIFCLSPRVRKNILILMCLTLIKHLNNG
jgi:hypothetical protein